MARRFGWVLAVLLIATGAWAQDIRGNGRLMGKVVDEQGKGIPNVTVRALFLATGNYLESKSNKNGDWTVDDVGEGSWEISFDADGYHPGKASAEVDDMGRSSSVKVTLKKVFDPNGFIKEQGAKADALMKQKDFAGARAIYEGIIAKVPEVSGQMQQFLARTYYMEGKPDKAAECLKASLAKEPDNLQTKQLLVSMLLETGAIDEASQMTASLGEANVTDAIYTSFGLALLKQKKAEEAIPYLDKAVAKAPQGPDGYYYRALARVDLVNAQTDPKDPARIERVKQIQEDLAKYLQLAPNAPGAANAKSLLDQIAKQQVQK